MYQIHRCQNVEFVFVGKKPCVLHTLVNKHTILKMSLYDYDGGRKIEITIFVFHSCLIRKVEVHIHLSSFLLQVSGKKSITKQLTFR